MIAFLLGITPLACFSAEFGFASWYGYPFHGRVAADGSVYDMEQITAAHKTLPLGSWVRVTNLKNGKVVDVRITDRGPFIDGRVIDLSRAAARAIDVLDPGTAPVRVEVLQAGLPVLMPSITATSTGPSITGMVLNEVTRANVEQMSSIAPIPARMPPSKTLEAKTLGAKTLAAETFAVQVGAYQDRGANAPQNGRTNRLCPFSGTRRYTGDLARGNRKLRQLPASRSVGLSPAFRRYVGGRDSSGRVARENRLRLRIQ
jgi:rare lipoprotein A